MWGLSGYKAQFTSLTKENCTVICRTGCSAHTGDRGPIGNNGGGHWEIEHKARSVDVCTFPSVRRQYV